MSVRRTSNDFSSFFGHLHLRFSNSARGPSPTGVEDSVRLIVIYHPNEFAVLFFLLIIIRDIKPYPVFLHPCIYFKRKNSLCEKRFVGSGSKSLINRYNLPRAGC